MPAQMRHLAVMEMRAPSRYSALDEWDRRRLLEQFEAAQADPGSAAAEVFRASLVHGAAKPRVPIRAWLSRWRWPLLAMISALVAAIACVVVGMLSPDESIDSYYFIAGFGGGIFGSTVVAAVGFLAEMKRFEIRSIEHLESDRFELKTLEQAMATRFTTEDGQSNVEAILEKINTSAALLDETLDGFRTQIERIERSLP